MTCKNAPAPASVDKRGLLNGALLIALWFVPDACGAALVFPFHRIAVAFGIGLASLLTPAVAGALITLIAILPLSSRSKTISYFALGFLGNVLVVLSPINHLPVEPVPALGLLAAVLLLAGFLQRRAARSIYVRLVLAALPGAVLLWSLKSAIAGQIPFTYLIVFKTPIALYLFLESAGGRPILETLR